MKAVTIRVPQTPIRSANGAASYPPGASALCNQPAIALDAESAEVLGNIKALL